MSNYQKNSKDYGEPDITYQLAGSAEQRQPRRHDTVSVHSRGDRHLGYSSRHTQVPVPATTTGTNPD